MILLLGILILGAAVFLAGQALTTGNRQVSAQVDRATSYTRVDPTAGIHQQKSARERLVDPMIQRLGNLSAKANPGQSRNQLMHKLRSAGFNVNPQTFLAAKSGLAIGFLGLGFVIASTGNIRGLAFGIMMAFASFMLPDMMITMRTRKRNEAMDRQLPDVLDLLTVSVEAGLGFDSAVGKVTEHMEGPLVEELALTLREIRYGESRSQALRNLADRADSRDIGQFARAIIQADELGTSLGRTLRVQSRDIRITRQLLAEETAAKAPVKMMFPTVLFILPALFLVILGPAALNIMEQFSNT